MAWTGKLILQLLGQDISEQRLFVIMPKKSYVNVVAAFDVDSSIVGQKIFDIEIVDISNIKDIVNKYDIKVAVMTVH